MPDINEAVGSVEQSALACGSKTTDGCDADQKVQSLHALVGFRQHLFFVFGFDSCLPNTGLFCGSFLEPSSLFADTSAILYFCQFLAGIKRRYGFNF